MLGFCPLTQHSCLLCSGALQSLRHLPHPGDVRGAGRWQRFVTAHGRARRRTPWGEAAVSSSLLWPCQEPSRGDLPFAGPVLPLAARPGSSVAAGGCSLPPAPDGASPGPDGCPLLGLIHRARGTEPPSWRRLEGAGGSPGSPESPGTWVWVRELRAGGTVEVWDQPRREEAAPAQPCAHAAARELPLL